MNRGEMFEDLSVASLVKGKGREEGFAKNRGERGRSGEVRRGRVCLWGLWSGWRAGRSLWGEK